MMKILFTTLALVLLFESSADAQFHDQGFENAVIRTDFDSQSKGLSSNPINYGAPCLFNHKNCGTAPITFSSSNAYFQNAASWPQSNYWVLSLNNEHSYNKVCPPNPPPNTCTPGQQLATTVNPGPPNQSLSRASPGFGIMGFTALVDSAAGEDFYRAHLVMNGTFANPALGGIPYLSLGAEHYRGNGSQVGSMAIQPGYSFCFRCRVKFKAKLWDFLLPDPVGPQPATLTFYLLARSYWDGKPRGLFIALAHWGIELSDST